MQIKNKNKQLEGFIYGQPAGIFCPNLDKELNLRDIVLVISFPFDCARSRRCRFAQVAQNFTVVLLGSEVRKGWTLRCIECRILTQPAR